MARSRTPHSAALAAAACAIACLPARAVGQVDAESFSRLSFNFNAAGARATALGGGAIALGDATSAESNPAGLARLLDRELVLEAKTVRYSRELAPQVGGGSFDDRVNMPAFVGVAWPVGTVTVGAFRHELVHYHNGVTSAGYPGGFGPPVDPFTSELDLEVTNVGAAVAKRFGTLSAGLSLGMSRLAFGLDFAHYATSAYLPADLIDRLTTDESSSALFVDAGVQIEMGTTGTAGVVYRYRGTFRDVTYQLNDGTTTTDYVRSLDIPDQAGAGISFAASRELRVGIEAVYNMYSQLSEDMLAVFSGASAKAFKVANGLDVRGGAELLVSNSENPVFLRAGAALAASSNVFYESIDLNQQRLWGGAPRPAIPRLSLGAGAILAQRLGLDAAVVKADDRVELVASTRLFLGR